MASEGQWEVVGKNGKKLSAIEAKKHKGKVELPKTEINNPLAGDKTIFQELQISKASAPKAQNGHMKVHATAVPDELPAVLAQNFPEQASEIKKRGSGFVGSKKKQAPSKPHKTDQDLLKEALAKKNYPMCMLPSDLKTLLQNLLKKCSQPTLKLVYKRSVENIVQDLKNGSSPYGDQIILQCIVKQNPQVVLQNIKELQEMLASPTRQPREIVALMWCAGPLPEENLIQGLRGECSTTFLIVVGLKGCMDACEVSDIPILIKPKLFELTMVEDSKMVIEGKKAKKSSFFSFGKLFKLILFLLVAVVTVDVYRHKGYKASKTAQIAKEYGIEQAALIGYGHVTEALDQGRSWVQANYPTYYSKFREVYDPASEFTWQKLTVAGAFIVEKSKPARDYLDAKIPVLLEKIETEVPVYFGIVRDHVQSFVDAWWPVVYKYLVIVWDFLSENVPIVLAKTQKLLVNLAYSIYELAPDFFSSIASGLAKLGEKIVEKLPGVIAVIQEYATIAFNLAVNLINSAVEQIQNMTARYVVGSAVQIFRDLVRLI
ncbi:PREDICTED: uncharacterized protein LOC107329059 [Acropora digitifera]|uniref:uncharacterized protein LOC107329059 n=1 Tax=Acropora digitifera TaxID=70779 RepID=UPI00077ADDE3|nr:PREDICTED: uncharacterized protein LOC107329059 [Acropora digitifera]